MGYFSAISKLFQQDVPPALFLSSYDCSIMFNSRTKEEGRDSSDKIGHDLTDNYYPIFYFHSNYVDTYS